MPVLQGIDLKPAMTVGEAEVRAINLIEARRPRAWLVLPLLMTGHIDRSPA